MLQGRRRGRRGGRSASRQAAVVFLARGDTRERERGLLELTRHNLAQCMRQYAAYEACNGRGKPAAKKPSGCCRGRHGRSAVARGLLSANADYVQVFRLKVILFGHQVLTQNSRIRASLCQVWELGAVIKSTVYKSTMQANLERAHNTNTDSN